MSDIIIKPYDAVHDQIFCDASITAELSEYFTFDVPGAEWQIRAAKKKAMKFGGSSRFQNWDGKIRLFNTRNSRLYAGLQYRVGRFADDRGYHVDNYPNYTPCTFTDDAVGEFIKALKLPEDIKEREYQVNAFKHIIRNHRSLILSPTGSGKSLLIYLMMRYFNKKTLIIVPTINLLNQMYNDFSEYGYYVQKHVRKIGGNNQTTIPGDYPVTISTWQSIYGLPKAYFAQYEVVVCDEVHGADAKSIKGIMEKLTDCYIRVGLTGTLKDAKSHRLTLEGLFGPVYVATTTAQMIEDKYFPDLDIKAITLQHPPNVGKALKKAKLGYANEIKYLTEHEKRNRFITNLAQTLKGNTLILFRMIDHGKALYKVLDGKRPTYLIYGATEAEEREQIRQAMIHKEENAILIGSYGCVSTGVNIPSLRNIIFASPYKSRIKVLQSIGRGMRKTEKKVKITVYDISDDMSYKGHMNYTLSHFVERIKLYAEERFNYHTYQIQLE